MKFVSKNIKDTEKLAEDFLTYIHPANQAVIMGLYGDLGSGKTTFTQCVAKILGVKETVTSPTFVIEKIYKLEDKNFSHLIHIDAYRLESGKELETLGWKEISEDPKNLIFIEWPERVSEILPENIQKIYFKFVDESTREVEWNQE